MAEIKIEKKKPIWPWILVLLVLAAVVYFVFFWDNNENEDADDTTVITDVTENEPKGDAITNNGEVAQYVNFMSDNANNMGLDHEFTNDALTTLNAATRSAADDADYDIKSDLDQAKEYADKITTDPYETSHANSIRKAADAIGSALQNLQQHTNPELQSEGAAVKDAASAINPDELTLDQKESVKSFFDKSATLLEKINQ